jgi:hypothetical protein
LSPTFPAEPALRSLDQSLPAPGGHSDWITFSGTPEGIERFIARVATEVGNEQKGVVRERLRKGLVGTIQEAAAIETNWRDCATKSEKVAESDYIKQHTDLLRDLVCNAEAKRKENEIPD